MWIWDIRTWIWNWNLSRVLVNYNTKEVKKEHNEEAEADEKTAEEEQGAPVPLVTHVQKILHSIFSNVDLYMNNQQIYNFNGLYALSYSSKNLKEAIYEYKGVSHCKGYYYEEFPDEIMEAPWSEPFVHKENENA